MEESDILCPKAGMNKEDRRCWLGRSKEGILQNQVGM